MIARSRRRFLAALPAALAVLVATGCGGGNPGTPAPSATASPGEPTGTPALTPGPGVAFNGCGSDHLTVSTPQFATSAAGTPAPGAVSEQDALTYAHATLLKSPLANQKVYCKAGLVAGSVAADSLPNHPPLPAHVWAVVVFVSVQNAGTPVPSDSAIQLLTGAYEVFFISPTQPMHSYGIVEYVPGQALPDALKDLDPQPAP